MCLIETKIYQHADGKEELIPRTHYCAQAVGERLCSNVEQRQVQRVQLEERRPRQDGNPDGYIVTQGPNGTERVYRDITGRHGGRKRNRWSGTGSNCSPPGSRSSLSPSSHVEVMPEAAPPPPDPRNNVAGLGVFRNRRPYQPEEDPQYPHRTELPGGTAVYSHTPAMDLPRASDNERRTPVLPPRDTPQSSSADRKAEMSETAARDIPHRRSAKVRFSPAINSSPDADVPIISCSPTDADCRHDSHQDLPEDRTSSSEYRTSRSQQTEDERQARIARGRIAATEQRQEARRSAEIAAREASGERIERHRSEARAKLEGWRRAEIPQEQLHAERARTAHEQAAAEQRRRAAEHNARVRGEQRDLASDVDAENDRPRVRSEVDEMYASTAQPFSPGSFNSGVQVHDYPFAGQNSTIQQGGEQWLAGEQSRAEWETRSRQSSQRMSDMLGVESGFERWRVNDYADEDMFRAREERRSRRHAAREYRNEHFWD